MIEHLLSSWDLTNQPWVYLFDSDIARAERDVLYRASEEMSTKHPAAISIDNMFSYQAVLNERENLY